MKITKIDTSPLSFFRFLFAVIIIYVHYGVRDVNNLRAGSIIVFFYMLSGFVLFLNYQAKGRIDLKEYFIKRILNVAPLYYLAFFIYVIVFIYTDQISPLGLFLAFFGIQSWIPNYQYYMNPPSWFVSGLLFFYLIFPVLFFLITKTAANSRKLLRNSIFLWLSTILVLNVLFNPAFYSGYFLEYYTFIDCFPLAHFCSFYMGVCGAYYMTENKITNFSDNSFRSIFSTALLILLFFLSITIHYQEDVGRFIKLWLPYEAGLFAPIILLMVINLSTERNILTKIFSSRIFILLGSISYALYILQDPIYHIYLKFIARPMELSHIDEFVFFIFPYIIIASILTFIESKTIKAVYKRYFSCEGKKRQDPALEIETRNQSKAPV